MYDTPRLWHPYEQSTLKGDVPIIGAGHFPESHGEELHADREARKLPTPSGVSAAQPKQLGVFRPQRAALLLERHLARDRHLRGRDRVQASHWLIRVLGVYNNNWIRVRENNLIDPDPRGTEFDDNREGAGSTQRHPGDPAERHRLQSEADGIPGNFETDRRIPATFSIISATGIEARRQRADLVPVDRKYEPRSRRTARRRRTGATQGSQQGLRRNAATPLGIAISSPCRKPSPKSTSAIFRTTTISSRRALAFSRSSRIFAASFSPTRTSARASSATGTTTAGNTTSSISTAREGHLLGPEHLRVAPSASADRQHLPAGLHLEGLHRASSAST